MHFPKFQSSKNPSVLCKNIALDLHELYMRFSKNAKYCLSHFCLSFNEKNQRILPVIR